MQKGMVWGCLVVLVLVAGAGLMAAEEVRQLLAPLPEDEPRLVTIPPGSSATDIGVRLEAAGIVRYSLVFRLWLRWEGYTGENFRAGEYYFRPGETLEGIVAKLQAGQPVVTILTVPEGLTVRQIARLVAQEGLASEEEFLAAAGRGELVEAFLPEGLATEELLEGYLFPDTYHLRPQATAEEVVEMMVARFHQVFSLELRERAAELGYTAHEIATLASIIEREAVVEPERPLISGVFHNRLEANWRLDADPTVLYAVGKTSGPVLRSDLEFVSPYNTYQRIGLPPGPIANFGEASLRAALYPAEVKYFFFVSRNDGTHDFSVTYQEHRRKVEQYQR